MKTLSKSKHPAGAVVGLGRKALSLLAGALLVAILPVAALAQGGAQTEQPPASVNPAISANVRSVESVVGQVYRLLVEQDGVVKGGTAFLVSGKRIVATNHHVVESGKAYSVGFLDRKGIVKRIPLKLLAIFPHKDLALLEALDDLPGEPLALADGYPAVATDLIAIGFPAAADPRGGLSWAQSDDSTFFIPSVLKGYVSRVLTNRWFSSQLQHQTPIIPGYSGGPLIDVNGSVLAISTAIHKDANGISYGVLAADLADFLWACSLPMEIVDTGGRQSRAGRSQPPATEAAKPETIKTTAQLTPPDEEMLARAYAFLDRGDIVAARLVFHYLADRRHLEVAYGGLAKSYDPLFLNQKRVIGIAGDAEKARTFYRKAATARRLAGQNGVGPIGSHAPSGTCNDSICSLVNGLDGPTVSCQKSDPVLAERPTGDK
ncbi:MAG: trypsin-like peptidase domain-containing protein [Rhodomicrobiaceae bacterium]